MALAWRRTEPGRLVSTDRQFRLTRGSGTIWSVEMKRGRRWACCEVVTGLRMAQAVAENISDNPDYEPGETR
jgi:hypothetical protein